MTHAPILWTLRIDPSRSLVHVHTRVRVHDGDRFLLPAWIPGSYMIREFVRGVQDLRFAAADGQPLRIEHPDKASWTVRVAAPTDVDIHYAVYGHELTVRTAHIDATHAFFNGANVILRSERYHAHPHHVQIHAPEGWESFVSLPVVQGAFEADDYVHLADTVFEIGPHASHRFDVDGIPHRFVFWGADGLSFDMAQLEADTIALIRQNCATFGRPLPYARYDIIFHVTPHARGGLEHRDSTTLATPWAYFETPEGYLDMLTLIAHEHFHAYNGRRLTPVSLATIDYSEENYTDALWVIEGFTSYFDELNTLRAGRMTYAQWLERTASSLNALHAVHGRTRQSLTEASHDAWIRLYRPYAHTRNQTVSYYLKGALVALAIDLSMRTHTDGARGLDDVMRALWNAWDDHGTAYTTDTVLALIGALSTPEVEEAARQWVTTPIEPPYRALLEAHGIRWEENAKPAAIGVDVDTSGVFAVVRSIDDARHDDVGGLFPGDEIVAIDGRRVAASEWTNRIVALQRPPYAATHTFQVFRLGRLTSVEVTLRGGMTITLHDEGHDPGSWITVGTNRPEGRTLS